MSRVHIIGGGLAGLSAAVELAAQAQVCVYESGPACGGRARSFYDRSLDAIIDNGNHLLLSANSLTFRYLDLIGSRHTLIGPGKPIFPFFDLSKHRGWTLRLSGGRIPFWVLPGGRRVPGMKLRELSALLKIVRSKSDKTVASCLGNGPFSQKLLEPFAVSALNTDIQTGSARLLGNIVQKSLALGGKACIPFFPEIGLSETFVDPAISYLERYHAQIHYGTRVTALHQDKGRITSITTSGGEVAVEEGDHVILAVTAPVAKNLLPDIPAPDEFESIANAHFRLPTEINARGVVQKARFIGLVGGVSEWLFLKGNVLSVTVSAANRYTERDSSEMLATIWSEIRRALDPVLPSPLPVAVPPARLLREKRATFAATPAQDAKRPSATEAQSALGIANLSLAGDWTQTQFPSTIEGAIQSGLVAVSAAGFRSRVSVT
ncbi:phytoene desaturase [Neokomagataea thailandica NBRC 106555]|uniref:FAD-binding protein n=2 Tax=Neokomagataea TaxID=1223423 RepID=A0A4Y6V625_9PROT|nr:MULTISPECIES: hydroxysqualene dehydroxylase HpnE [Neokomagataea]QDH25592.1 FAD-binding protein [Neokomagataea tanensis]GBR52599.1 phytoene desaturase [Neokomagataea thailandica NBRC 106555]